jgi:hypothetical protein
MKSATIKRLWKDPKYRAARLATYARNQAALRQDRINIIFPRPLIKKGDCIGYLSLPGGPRSEMGWNGGRTVLSYKGERWVSSRLSFHLNVHEISRQLPQSATTGQICHTCNHPWCINPKHLYYGSKSSNAHDAYRDVPDYREKVGRAASISKKKYWEKWRASHG